MATLLDRSRRELEALTVSNLPGPPLTAREHAVLELVAEGRTNREIGGALHVSEHTVANHVRSILLKSGTSNRTEAANWASRNSLLAR